MCLIFSKNCKDCSIITNIIHIAFFNTGQTKDFFQVSENAIHFFDPLKGFTVDSTHTLWKYVANSFRALAYVDRK